YVYALFVVTRRARTTTSPLSLHERSSDLQAAGSDVQPQVPAAVLAAGPAIAGAVALETVGAQRFQGRAAAQADLFAEPVHAQSVHSVFQARVLAFAAVAVVALQGDHGFGHGHHVLRPGEAD